MREQTEHRGCVFRFADVEVSEREFSVVKAGEVLSIEPKAFKVLQFLLHNPGRVIPKDELLDAVWNDCEVSESSLTRSIAMLRRLLGDDIREPRFIATVATVGYRFVCPVAVDDPENPEAVSALPDAETPRLRDNGLSNQRGWWAAGIAVAVAVAVALFLWQSRSTQPVVEGALQLTDDGNQKVAAQLTTTTALVSDGSRIYFNELQSGSWVIAQVAATGGQTGQIASKIPSPALAAVAPDYSSLLVLGDDTLWLLPLPAGEPRKLPNLATHGATFFPDGHMVFGKGTSLYAAEKDGSNPRKLFDFPSRIDSPVVSPDGTRIRVTVIPNPLSRSLWEVGSDGSGAHPLWPGVDACYGRWTPDGRYFVFQSRWQGRTDLWAVREPKRPFGRSSSPFRLTNGPISYELPYPSPDEKHIYAIGLKPRGELVRFDRNSQQFVPYLSGISAINATVSSDGKWVTYMSYPDRNLWRSRVDGSDRLQLTYPPTSVDYPHISPNGRKVAYSSMDAACFLCPYVVSLEGGAPRKIAENAKLPTWSPDSNSVVVIVTSDISSASKKSYVGLRTIDLQTGKISSIPDSGKKGGTSWVSRDMLVAPIWEGGRWAGL
jgi:DNA-binding winged helix-turn-helix (wHTH) protein